MDWWIAEAMELAQKRAQLLDDEHAADLADDLHRAWPEMTPAEAVDKFFAIVVPLGWKAAPMPSSAAPAPIPHPVGGAA